MMDKDSLDLLIGAVDEVLEGWTIIGIINIVGYWNTYRKLRSDLVSFGKSTAEALARYEVSMLDLDDEKFSHAITHWGIRRAYDRFLERNL